MDNITIGTTVYTKYDAEVAVDHQGHRHWTVQACREATPEGYMFDSTDINVEAPDEDAALAMAMGILKRPLYRVKIVDELCDEQLAKNK